MEYASGFAWTARQFVGGNPALDLANTLLYARDPARATDRLAARSDFTAWLAAARRFGALPDAAPPCAAEPDDLAFRQAVLLRAAVRLVFGSRDKHQGTAGSAAALILDSAARAAGALTTFPTDLGRVASGNDSVALAFAALDLLTRVPRERIGTCPNCHWLFIDQSRNRSRRWCDMLTCGNLAKGQRQGLRAATTKN